MPLSFQRSGVVLLLALFCIDPNLGAAMQDAGPLRAAHPLTQDAFSSEALAGLAYSFNQFRMRVSASQRTLWRIVRGPLGEMVRGTAGISAIVVLAASLLTGGMAAISHDQHRHVREHGRPAHQSIPLYDPHVMLALQRLSQADASLWRYLRQDKTPIHYDSRLLFQKYFAAEGVDDFYSAVLIEPKNEIGLDRSKFGTSEEMAAAIGHELVHSQHGDPAQAASHHSLWRHIFLTSEEDEAQLAQGKILRILTNGRKGDIGFLEWWAYGRFVAFVLLSAVALSRRLWRNRSGVPDTSRDLTLTAV